MIMILDTTKISKKGITINLLVLHDAAILVMVSLTGHLIILLLGQGRWEDLEPANMDTVDDPTLSSGFVRSKYGTVDISHLTVKLGVTSYLLWDTHLHQRTLFKTTQLVPMDTMYAILKVLFPSFWQIVIIHLILLIL